MASTKVLRAVLLVALAVGLTGVAPTAVSAAPIPLPGTLVSATVVPAGPLLGPDVVRYQIRYLTIDGTGDPVVATGVVLAPATASQGGSRTVVAWGHGTSGIADRCAPSRSAALYPGENYDVYADEVRGFLDDGHIVVAPDYVGLGSPGQHEYLIGGSEGRSTIDAVRAARQLGIGAGRDWVSVGHSQGGQGALFSGELARSYAPELSLRGVVAIAPASNLDVIVPQIAGTEGQGYLAFALKGLEAVYPNFEAEDVLAAPGEALLPLTEIGCYGLVLTAYAGLSAEQMVEGGVVSEEVVAMFARSNPGQRATAAPILLVQGTADLAIPAELTYVLARQLCAQDDVVDIRVYPGEGHDSTVVASSVEVRTWVNERFSGLAPRDICP